MDFSDIKPWVMSNSDLRIFQAHPNSIPDFPGAIFMSVLAAGGKDSGHLERAKSHLNTALLEVDCLTSPWCHRVPRSFYRVPLPTT